MKRTLLIAVILLLPAQVWPHRWQATYYYPGNARLADGSRPTGDWCAARGRVGQTAVIKLRDGRTIRLECRDYCPLPSRCDVPHRTFVKIFGRHGVVIGKIPVEIRWETKRTSR